jgi:hypothetical protein
VEKMAQRVLNCPKFGPIQTDVINNFSREKVSPKVLATFIFFQKLAQSKKWPKCENAPNLVALLSSLRRALR